MAEIFKRKRIIRDSDSLGSGSDHSMDEGKQRDPSLVAFKKKDSQASVVNGELPCNSKDIDEKEVNHSCCGPEKNILSISLRLLACIFAGIIFGLACEKGRVFEPEVVRNQMIFKSWILMKMFLSALATAQLCLALMSLLPPTRYQFLRAADSFTCTFTEKGFLSSAIGPFILGVGMTVAGSCPGLVLAQVGATAKNAWITFCGGLVGALLYGLLHPMLMPLLRPSKPLKIQTIHQKIGTSYAGVSIAFAIVIITGLIVLEILVPWRDDLPSQRKGSLQEGNVFQWTAWPPTISGVLIGSMQIVIVLAVHDTLGGSSSYQTLVSQWVVGPKLSKTFTYMSKYRCGIGNWWQVVYVFAAMLGGLLSSLLSDTLNTTRGVPNYLAFIGGVCMIFGARFASGCTSGHGISGAALLHWLSWIAVPCMFGGAILCGILFNIFGVLDNYDCAGLNITC